MSTQLATIGRYRLLEPIGHGGMATVYRGHDDQLGRPVAIKLLADNLAGDEAFRRRFLREARLAAHLHHPSIVHVYDTGEDDGRPYIIMEYVEGETLADELARAGRLEPSRAVSLMIQACAGLDHAHASGLVHRDIKPQNLLVRDDGTLKIADFGIARSAHGTRLTEAGSVLGTAAYLAPEQVAGEDVTPAGDIYSLGVVLYQLLAGQTPYSYDSLSELFVAQNQQIVPPLRDRAPEVPAELEEVVMRCLARLPEYRPQTAGTVADALAATVAELPTRVLSQSEGAATERTVRPGPNRSPSLFRQPRRRVLAVAAAAAAAVAILLVVLAAGGRDQGPRLVPPVDKPALQQARDLSQWLAAQRP